MGMVMNKIDGSMSPSIRREWIEIMQLIFHIKRVKSPSIRREWIEICRRFYRGYVDRSLPPYGGSGLKCDNSCRFWREWYVSLHTEGVD